MKVRRKIMALGTALAMAFVMIASLVMVTDVKAMTKSVSSVGVTISAPDANTVIKKVTNESSGAVTNDPAPSVTVSGEGVINENAYWVIDPDNVLKEYTEEYGGESFSYWDFNSDNVFSGTVEAGKDYYAAIELSSDSLEGYEWADDCAFTVSGGGTLYKVVNNPNNGSNVKFVVAKVTIAGGGTDPSEDPTPTVPTIDNGSTVEVAPAEDGTVTFRFEKDLEYFENGGKLYIDGQEVPADMYKATRGSTIIALFKEYAAKLADGAEHAVKVVFNDNTSVEGKIVVKAASSDSSASTAANGTSGTASSTAATTTTKATAAKTADALPYAGLALVFVGATAIGVIAIRRKNS